LLKSIKSAGKWARIRYGIMKAGWELMKTAYIGIDCGGTNIRIAGADTEGQIIFQKTVPTFQGVGSDGLEEKIRMLVEEMLQSLKKEAYQTRGIGMGIPGVYFGKEVIMCPNIGGIKARELVSYFYSEYGLPFAVMNDVKCAALGEKWLGAARESDNIVFLNIGTGLSLALILNGEVYMGEYNASGELGYWIYDPETGRGFDSGRAPLEELCSGKGISDSVKAACGSSADNMDTKRIFEEYRRGNPEIARVVDGNMKHLIVALANICILLNPSMIVFGGSVSESIELFFDRIKQYFLSMVPFPPDLVRSELGGNAGLYGALRLAMQAGTPKQRRIREW
jgi:glucokinase